jgi:hypothetical protein
MEGGRPAEPGARDGGVYGSGRGAGTRQRRLSTTADENRDREQTGWDARPSTQRDKGSGGGYVSISPIAAAARMHQIPSLTATRNAAEDGNAPWEVMSEPELEGRRSAQSP